MCVRSNVHFGGPTEVRVTAVRATTPLAHASAASAGPRRGARLGSLAVKPGPTTGAAPWPACLKMKYMAHLSNVGDTGWYDAPAPVQGGFEGVAFRLEGTCASSYVVEYQCWVQGIGDVPLTTGPSFCGTRGQGRRLEAVRLTVRKR